MFFRNLKSYNVREPFIGLRSGLSLKDYECLSGAFRDLFCNKIAVRF